MHILITAVSRFTTPTGICRHAANLANSLVDRPEIDQVTLVTGTWQRYYTDLVRDRHSKLQIVPIEIQNTSLSRNRWFYFELPKLAASQRASILHLSFPLPTPRSSRYRTVVTLHDLYPYECPEVFGYPNVLLNRLFLRHCLSNSDAIACVSASTLQSLRNHFPHRSHNAYVVPNSVPSAIACERAPDGWDGSQFVLAVAQHRHNKNLILALRGFAAMREKELLPTGTKFVIVGSSGPETPALLREISILNLAKEVVLLNSLPEAELQWLYRHCTLFLVTSQYEGFCLPLLEALRANCRVVCSALPVLREIGVESCFYFEVRDSPISNLLHAARRALSQPKLTPPDLHRYLPASVGSAYVQLYESLIARLEPFSVIANA